MFLLNVDAGNCLEATVYVHKLPPCDSCAHLEYHVPEQLTMKYLHVQSKKRACCCLNQSIQIHGRIAFGDDSPWCDVKQNRWYSGHI